ncbi:MAG: pyridoxamine 5'-phosphate oxidase family protein [Myxococcota bacterium]
MQRRLLVLAHGRSGSTTLAHLIDAHPRITLVDEPFHEHRTAWDPDLRPHRDFIVDEASLEAEVERVLAEGDGFKMLLYQLDRDWVEWLIQRPDFGVVVLHRRNRLEAAVSWSVAHQTQLWARYDVDDEEALLDRYRELEPLDPEQIRTSTERIDGDVAWALQTARTYASDRHLELVYEELYGEDPARQAALLKALWALAGVPPMPFEDARPHLDRSNKLNSAETLSRVPNLGDIAVACGSDEMGWLSPWGLPDRIDDPLALFAADLERITASDGPEGRLACLATVDANGQPHARTVSVHLVDGVLRTWSHRTSPKVTQLTRHPRCELTLWWPSLQRQFRLQGRGVWVPASQRPEAYATRPGTSRRWYWLYEELPKSTVVGSRAELLARYEALAAGTPDPDTLEPPPGAGLVEVTPDRIEIQQIERARRLHDRRRFVRRGEEWHEDQLVP